MKITVITGKDESGKSFLAKNMIVPSCQDCFYSKGGRHSCDRHLNKVKPDYSKGVECYCNDFAHFKPYKA